MDSLYGGKPGLSFILKGSFKSIAEMNSAFEKGDGYTDIWYGEHCIIDTPNKNHPDNGKIFKRGINYYNKDTASLDSLTECIGQIVGPSSGTPSFYLGSLIQKQEDGSEKYVLPQQAKEKEEEVDVYLGDPTSSLPVKGYIRRSSDSEKAAITFKEGNSDNSLNTATYTWQNIRVDASDENQSNSWFGVELTVPTQTNIFEAKAGSPYKEKDLLTTKKINSFYQTHTIDVPRGIQGISITNLGVKTLPSETGETYYSAEDVFSLIKNDGTLEIKDLPKREIPSEETSFLVGTVTSYQRKKEEKDEDGKVVNYVSDPISYNVIFASYDQVKNMEIDDKGILTTTYTGEKAASTVFLDYIKSAKLTSGDGSEGGALTFFDSDGKENSTSSISWVKNIEIEEDGRVILTFAGTPSDKNLTSIIGEKGKYELPNSLVWPTEIKINENTGKYDIINNKKEQTSGQFVFPKEVKFQNDDPENENSDKAFYVVYSDDKESEPYYPDSVKSIIAKDGDFYYTRHDGNDDTGKGLFQLTDFKPLNSIKDIKITEIKSQAEGTDSGSENNEATSFNLEKTYLDNGTEKSETMVSDISMLSSGTDAIIFNSGERFEQIVVEEEDENGEIVTNISSGLPLLQGDRKLRVKYSLPKDQEIITEPINSIEDVAVYRNKIYVLYGDINARNQGYENGTSGLLKPGWELNLNGTFYNKELATKTGVTYLWKSIGDISPNGYQFADRIDIATITNTIKSEGVEGAGTSYTDSIEDILVYLEAEYFNKRLDEKYDTDVLDKIRNGFLVAVTFPGAEDSYSKLFFRKVTYYEEEAELREQGIWFYVGTLLSGDGISSNSDKNEIDLTSSTPDSTSTSAEFLFAIKGSLSTGSTIDDPWTTW